MAADLGACLGLPAPACFTAARAQTAAVVGEPVTGPPINLSATVNGSTVTLTWGLPGVQDSPVLSYIIDAGSTPNFNVPDLVSIDTFSTSTTLEASGVAPGTYYVRVRARNALGISAPSNEIQVVVGIVIIPGPGPGPNCPSAPRSLNGTASLGSVTLVWQTPLNGAVQSYVLEAGTSAGASNIGTINNGLATVFSRTGVPAGVYYLRVRALAAGCPPSAASNELALTVSAALPPAPPGPSGSATLTLVYNCGPCTGDPDNYALNVDCVNGRCRTNRTSNATRSGTIVATVIGAGVHNVEVRAIRASWTLTITGAMIPGSWRILDPFGGAGLSVGSCRISSSVPEIFTEFTVGGAGSPSC